MVLLVGIVSWTHLMRSWRKHLLHHSQKTAALTILLHLPIIQQIDVIDPGPLLLHPAASTTPIATSRVSIPIGRAATRNPPPTSLQNFTWFCPIPIIPTWFVGCLTAARGRFWTKTCWYPKWFLYILSRLSTRASPVNWAAGVSPAFINQGLTFERIIMNAFFEVFLTWLNWWRESRPIWAGRFLTWKASPISMKCPSPIRFLA